MAEFSKLVITKKGQALIAKVLEGAARDVAFTKVAASAMACALEEAEDLSALTEIMQETAISAKARTNDVAVRIEAAFSNEKLTVGYQLRALGLYAVDPDEGEILYAVTLERSGNCYMPAYNGVTVSGAFIQLITTVGNAQRVSLEVSPAAAATFADLRRLEERLTLLMEKSGMALVIGDEEPEGRRVLWFDTGFGRKRTSGVTLALGGEGDESDVSARIDGRDSPVTNAGVESAGEDGLVIQIFR